MDFKLSNGEFLPLELHKTTLIKKLNLPSVDERLTAIEKAGHNTFLLKSTDIFLDMLTDSGSNAMSINQQAAMFLADDAYAGCESFYRLENVLKKVFKKEFFLPAHQGRACEHLLSKSMVKPGDIVPTNYHFTTSRAHVTVLGGEMVELFTEEAMKITSDHPFKGNMDVKKLEDLFAKNPGKVPFVRLEAGTNLIGGQPISLENIKAVHAVCKKNKTPLVLDASLLQDNLYFIKTREKSCEKKSILEITNEIADNVDIIYFSARKLGAARGGGICLNDPELASKIRTFVPLYEGFITYGGISAREIEAIAVGIEETMDMENICQGPQFIKYAVQELVKAGVPVVTPAGGLGIHLNANAFLKHVPVTEFQSGSLAAALYLISGIRAMERGTMSEERGKDGSETIAHMELVRLACPRRVFTLSHIKYAIDRIIWLWNNRELVGGLKWHNEPKILRFFFGEMATTSDWQKKLVAKFKKDFPDAR